MKAILLATLLVAMPVKAEVIAYTMNRNGGKIVITTEICRDGKNRLAYSQSDNFQTILGCWINDNAFIHIQWYDADLRSYPYDGWTMVAKPKPTM